MPDGLTNGILKGNPMIGQLVDLSPLLFALTALYLLLLFLLDKRLAHRTSPLPTP
jgi:hypothetical protein